MNPDCPIVKCKMCFGGGKVTSQYNKKGLKQAVTFPCPNCSGLGFEVFNCQLFYKEVKSHSLKFPPGSRAGYKVSLPGEGNDIIENLQKVTGNLEVHISKVNSKRFKVLDDRIELLVEMTVFEALEVIFF